MKRTPLLFAALLFAAASVLPVQAEFSFEKGDRVCIVGNALPDRMQHHGWMETLLHAAYPEHDLVIRNLGFAGDQVKERPRSKGWWSPEQYLEHCQADVIFAMFGYNESWAGEGGVDRFRKELAEMVDKYRGAKFNGESNPRLVLFTPIAFEDHKSPDLPRGRQHNRRLALYAAAVKQVAEDKGTGFVDLFAPSASLYQKAARPLSLNGCHLLEEGNRQLAEVIVKSLSGKTVPADASRAKLRSLVLNKNLHWHNRYRATDGNDVWGGRSGLKFVDGQTNREVMQQELVMFDVLTANRDQAIHALARGRAPKIDDSNMPEPVPVISNVGGGSKSSNKDKEGSTTYISGEEGLARMKIPMQFQVNLFADEKMFPELVNPVQTAVDTKGRLWVAAWKTYPKWEPGKQMEDRLLILPDENRDGVADKAITFARVQNPTAFEFWNGGVLVASCPDVIFLKDTDGDDVADVRVRMLQGLDSADTHHAANAFVYGPDGGIYYQRGVFHVSNVETPWGPNQKSGASAMYRWDPRQHTFGFHANNSPNPHGISFDRWGYHYATDGTGGRSYQVRPEGRGFKMHSLLNKQCRPVAASGIVSSQQWPEENQQNFILCNTIGYLGIKQYVLNRDPKTGVVKGEPAPDNDLVVSSDKNFRPTDIEFGDDGALYFADWSNVIIGHMQHNIRDPNRDHKHGRVYRMIAKGRPLQKHVPIDGQPIEALLENLRHPVDGVRYRTRIELSEHPADQVIEATRKWIAQFDPEKIEDAHPLLEALWLHQQHNVRNPDLLGKLLVSPEPHARIAANTVQHHWYTVNHRKNTEVAAEDDAGKGPVLPKPEAGVTDIVISTVVEQMKYDRDKFSVKAGSEVRIVFYNPDYMPHNLLVVQPGAADEVANAALLLGAKGFDLQWVPQSDKILAGSKLIDTKKQEIIRFTAPNKPGDYQYVCTFPGHSLLMRGVMKVTE